MSLKFCIIIESNSQKTFLAIVLYTNMAAVSSRENRELMTYCTAVAFRCDGLGGGGGGGNILRFSMVHKPR